jgi:hypothetical protein
MNKFTDGLNGISADLLKAVTQVSAESNKRVIEQARTENAALADKMSGFKPLAKDQIVRESRPIERLYAGMTPNKVEVQKEETLAQRVRAVTNKEVKIQEKVTSDKVSGRTPEIVLTDDDMAFLAQVEEQTHPTTDKEKKLAAMAHPKDKITHKDVMVGRGVIAKEGWDDMLKAAEKRRAEKKTGETTKTDHDVKKISTGTVYTKKYNQKSGLSENKGGAEEKDTPGQEHICAVHVKHSKLGEGKTLFSQHAEPAEDGSIAWYDVMFAEGIVRVDTKDIEILVSEAHMNHKRKM